MGNQRLRNIHILIVEDDPLDQWQLENLLRAEAATVLTVSSGRQAIAALADATPPFDLVLMNVQMPEIDGLEASRRIRQLPSSIPIIGLMTRTTREGHEQCLAAGMVSSISKPLHAETLVSLILAKLPAEKATDLTRPLAVDWKALTQRYQRKPEFILRLSRLAMQSHLDDIARLRRLISERKAQEIGELAHALKGVAGNLCAPELEQSAMQLLVAVRGNEPGYLAQAGELAEALERFIAALHARLNEA